MPSFFLQIQNSTKNRNKYIDFNEGGGILWVMPGGPWEGLTT